MGFLINSQTRSLMHGLVIFKVYLSDGYDGGSANMDSCVLLVISAH